MEVRSLSDRLDLNPERLVGAHADTILRLCYTYLGSTQDAEDVCQDTLIKLIGRGQPFRSAEHEKAWVVRVAINACKDLLRTRSAHPQVTLDAAPEPEAVPSVSEEEAASRGAYVLAAVQSLPEAYREAIYLHYYEGYTIHGIALVTDRSEAAVSQLLSRGRRQLRSILKEDYDELYA